MIALDEAILTNAAGMVKTLEQGRKLLNSAVTRITLGSYTLLPRVGNIEDNYYYDVVTGAAYNSKGLDNRGFLELLTWLPAFYEECRAAGKELAVSLAGFSPEEYGEMAAKVAPYCDRVEVNAGCGNVWLDSVQKPIPSYEPSLLHAVLQKVGSGVRQRPMVGVKVSPVPDHLIDPLARVLRSYPFVVEAVGTNTEPNQSAKRPDGSEALAWREKEGSEVKHTGGMSGKLLKPAAMRVVGQLIDLVPRLKFIYCGGISSGQDFIDGLNLGAAGGAIGTAFFESSERLFQDVFIEASDILEAA